MTAPGAGVPPTGAPAPGAGARRRRQWVPVLVAVDAVLVAAVLLVLLLTRAGGGSAAPPGASATGTTGTVATPATTPTPGPPRFELPSGNIGCDMTADGVTCTIGSEIFTPPAAPGCDGGTVGHTVVLDAHGVSVPCVRAPASPPGTRPVLFYGASSTVGAYTCTSATNGVTCTGPAGVGFRLAREALVTLP